MLKNVLTVLLIILSIVMITLGYQKSLMPPILTGIGFIVIALLFKIKEK